MNRVVCPGTFDPVTNGHLDVIERASRMYGEVVAVVLINSSKTTLFSLDERVEMLRMATASLANVKVASFEGLLVDYCLRIDAGAVVRGIRVVGDLEYELQMAQMNVRLSGLETIFMAANPEHSFLSSSLIKEVVQGGKDVSGMVPEHVAKQLQRRLS